MNSPRITRADNHCHISKEYFDDPIAEIKALKENSELEYICIMGVNYENDKENLQYKAAFSDPFLKIGLGLHPSDVIELKEYSLQECDRIISLIRQNLDIVDVIGEIGIDFTYPDAETYRAEQIEVFKRFCELARETGKPVSIHARGAMNEVLAVVGEVFDNHTEHGYLHCFTGNFEDAKVLRAHGLKLGIGGIITFKKSVELRETVQNVINAYPDKTFDELCGLETDSPYLSPEPIRSSVNTPRNIAIIADFIEINM